MQGGTFGLGFNTLPVVFAHMGVFGNFVGALWFFMLFLAAITSSISMYQPSLAFFEEALGWSRKQATSLMVAICIVGSFLVMYYSKGGIFWSTIDDWVGTFLIFVLAMVQIICFSWVFGIKQRLEEAHHGAQLHIPRFYRFIMKYVTPTYLLVVFAAFSWQNLPALDAARWPTSRSGKGRSRSSAPPSCCSSSVVESARSAGGRRGSTSTASMPPRTERRPP